jgi:hypothetical protein
VTEEEKKIILNQPVGDRRLLLERMPGAIARALNEGRLARAEALTAEYEFLMEIESGTAAAWMSNSGPRPHRAVTSALSYAHAPIIKFINSIH